MRYAMLLKPHPNVRYRQSLQKLAPIEFQCIAEAWSIRDARPEIALIQDEPFLTFETEEMTDGAWRALSSHSGICLAAVLEGDALKPLRREQRAFLPEDLSQVLKYKGKTNADFTRMLLHCAKAASAFAREDGPLCVLDPLCGKGTTLFCALQEGDGGVGVERDAKALEEADRYFERFLQTHRLKYRKETGARTLPKGECAKTVSYSLAPSAESMKQGNVKTLRLIHGDTLQLSALVRAESAHLVVGDLPYGIQHAPRSGREMSTLQGLVWEAMPLYATALRPGGVAALAFNTHTLKRRELAKAMRSAGLEVLDAPPYDDFEHWVEQAVNRDVVIARKG